MEQLTNKLKEATTKSIRPGTFIVPECHARRLVIPDIHGCPNTFRELIEKIGLTKEDQLFLLGDYIDKGMDSKGVLDLITELDEAGYQLYPIRGNHEQMLLDITRENNYMLKSYAQRERLSNLIEENQDGSFSIKQPYAAFLEALPYFFELEDFFIVHAGFNFKAEDPFRDFDEMLWIREFHEDREWVGEKPILHGHTPCYKEVILEAIHNHYPIIPLDNGCVFSSGGAHDSYGNLLCLNLDTFEVVFQPNINDLVN